MSKLNEYSDDPVHTSPRDEEQDHRKEMISLLKSMSNALDALVYYATPSRGPAKPGIEKSLGSSLTQLTGLGEATEIKGSELKQIVQEEFENLANERSRYEGGGGEGVDPVPPSPNPLPRPRRRTFADAADEKAAAFGIDRQSHPWMTAADRYSIFSPETWTRHLPSALGLDERQGSELKQIVAEELAIILSKKKRS